MLTGACGRTTAGVGRVAEAEGEKQRESKEWGRGKILSGFLASEEIYINQLEALLLVSTWGRGVVAPCQPMSCFKTVLGVGEDPWRADTSVPLFATKHLENWVSHCLISVTVL